MYRKKSSVVTYLFFCLFYFSICQLYNCQNLWFCNGIWNFSNIILTKNQFFVTIFFLSTIGYINLWPIYAIFFRILVWIFIFSISMVFNFKAKVINCLKFEFFQIPLNSIPHVLLIYFIDNHRFLSQFYQITCLFYLIKLHAYFILFSKLYPIVC